MRGKYVAVVIATSFVVPIIELSATPAQSWAQSYPTKPVRILVPAPAGGPTDVPGRIIAEGLSRLTNGRFIVENRVGAGGIIAAEAIARSAPDGYTLFYANTSVLAVVPAIQTKLPYDPASFVPIGFVSNTPQALVVNPKLPYKTMKELLTYAKANPGKINWASGGPGSLPQLTYELFKLESGIDATLIHYSGGDPALTAVVSGQSDVMFTAASTRLRNGDVRGLALTGSERHPDVPDIPTTAELGLPNVTATSGTGLVGPAGMPKDIAILLNAKLNELLKDPGIQAKMKGLGLLPVGGTPEAFGAWANEQRRKWIRVVKDSGAKIE
ncbi:MAG: Bug family tripartite tricarboxylate transporter substrate binding protein [Burkholderiales bacterium]